MHITAEFLRQEHASLIRQKLAAEQQAQQCVGAIRAVEVMLERLSRPEPKDPAPSAETPKPSVVPFAA